MLDTLHAAWVEVMESAYMCPTRGPARMSGHSGGFRAARGRCTSAPVHQHHVEVLRHPYEQNGYQGGWVSNAIDIHF
eukprot:4512622-Amphidinium_carterae.3